MVDLANYGVSGEYGGKSRESGFQVNLTDIFFFFYWTDGSGYPHTVQHTEKFQFYSRDETTDKYHFSGIARRVEED